MKKIIAIIIEKKGRDVYDFKVICDNCEQYGHNYTKKQMRDKIKTIINDILKRKVR